MASKVSFAAATVDSQTGSAGHLAQPDPANETVSTASERTKATATISKKPRKKARIQNRPRHRGWYDAYAWRPRAWYGRSYGYGYWRFGW
jgi:hypothetical protein